VHSAQSKPPLTLTSDVGNLSQAEQAIVAIAVADHVEKLKKPDYDYKSFNNDEEWAYSLANKNCLVFEQKWLSTNEKLCDQLDFVAMDRMKTDDYV
jgi:hypothetical protein